MNNHDNEAQAASAPAALAVHDLKNALGALEAELLLLAGSPSLEAAQDAHRHCAQLRERFVMYLTLYGGGPALHAQPSDESPLEMLQNLASGASRLVQLSSPSVAPPFWYFDRHLVRLALQAALHNAERFAQNVIVLNARQEAGFLVFSIEDDGPGLSGYDPSDHSTGLGTQLCAAVARAHTSQMRMGHVSLKDRESGGARFELWLP